MPLQEPPNVGLYTIIPDNEHGIKRVWVETHPIRQGE
jgi:hypothetical protein